jgi:hypothetical protein
MMGLYVNNLLILQQALARNESAAAGEIAINDETSQMLRDGFMLYDPNGAPRRPPSSVIAEVGLRLVICGGRKFLNQPSKDL